MEFLKDRLEQSIRVNWHRNAVCTKERSMTYGQLSTFIKSLSEMMDAGETARNVLCFMNRGVDAIFLLAAVICSDKVFCPVETRQSDGWILNVIKEQQSNIVVTDRANYSRISGLNRENRLGLKIIRLDVLENIMEFFDANERHTGAATPPCVSDLALQYVYYTSGSQGHSKGVLGRKTGLFQFLDWEIQTFMITNEDHFLQLTNPNFDPYLRDILVPLFIGATIYVPPESSVLNPKKLFHCIEEYNISVIHMVPSLFRKLLQHHDRFGLNRLRYILLAGEPLFGQDVREFYRKTQSKTQLVNLYGPTETTLAKFYHIVTPDDGDREIVPVGGPIGRTRAYIADEGGNDAGINQPGEIIIETYEASAGYFNKAIQENENFHFSADGRTRYRTKDRGLLQSDGKLLVLGRLNNSVKVLGQKVDLDWLSLQVKRQDFVRDCCVFDVLSSKGTVLLVAAVTVSEDLKEQDIMARISTVFSENQEVSLLPSRYIVFDEFPSNLNGKLNRLKLREEVQNRVSQEREETISEEDDTLEKLRKIINQSLGANCVAELCANDRFVDLGVDSLSMLDIVFNIEDVFQISVDETQLELSELRVGQMIEIIQMNSIQNIIHQEIVGKSI